MKTKFFFLPLVLTAALLLGACGGTVAPALSAASTPQASTRTLTVSGNGQVSVTPDIAYIYIGVHTEEASAAQAVADNNTGTQNVVKALTGIGVDAEDIRTSNFSIYQNTQYGPDNKPTGITYVVDNSVHVTVRDLSKLGDLLDAAVKAGANNINSIQFDVADKSAALSQASAMAVDDAKKQAQDLASEAGVQLGDIQNISNSESVPGPIYEAKGLGGGAAAASSVPINTGSLQISASVTITYEIK